MSNLSFEELQLSDGVFRALKDMGFETPTEIQAKAIPLIREGKDIIGKSHTGTGKTVAFGVPAVECCDTSGQTQVLVLCPTRELAMQASDEIRKIAKYTEGIRAVPVYGGQPIQNQIPLLRRGAEIVIGTPGRIMDHIHRKTLKLDSLKMIVLDEADEMLNMGFREDIETILTFVPEARQTILFSATMPAPIMEITSQYQKDPQLISAGQGTERTIHTVEQYYFEVPMGSKMEALSLLLHTHQPKLSIIFCNTKKMVDELTRYLNENGFNASALHGDMKQEARTAVMNSFRSGRTPILIATDVAARGIDVDNVDAVYNFDIPQDYEYYIHRIGRTGRAGKSGVSYTLAGGRRQVYAIRDIENFTKAKIVHKALPCTQDIVVRKQSELLEEIKKQLDALPESSEGAEQSEKTLNPMLAKLLDEGYSAESTAEALLNILVQREVEHIPVITIPKPVSTSAPLAPAPEGYVRLRFSVGRNQRVAPNHLVAAIADMTKIPGKSIAKIHCYGDYSLVEVPSKFKALIISKVSGQKIGGIRTDVRIYDSKTGASGASNRTTDRNHGFGDKSGAKPSRNFHDKGHRNDRGLRRNINAKHKEN